MRDLSHGGDFTRRKTQSHGSRDRAMMLQLCVTCLAPGTFDTPKRLATEGSSDLVLTARLSPGNFAERVTSSHGCGGRTHERLSRPIYGWKVLIRLRAQPIASCLRYGGKLCWHRTLITAARCLHAPHSLP